MHELSVTRSVLDIALAAARDADASRIAAIDLLVGDLTGFVTDSIQFYFDMLSKGTAAEGAVLRVRRAPANATCAACGHTFQPELPLLPLCPLCGGSVRLTGGRELRVTSLEVA